MRPGRRLLVLHIDVHGADVGRVVAFGEGPVPAEDRVAIDSTTGIVARAEQQGNRESLWIARLVQQRTREIELVEQWAFFQMRQNGDYPVVHATRARIDLGFTQGVEGRRDWRAGHAGAGIMAAGTLIIGDCQGDLADVVLASDAAGGFAGRLHGRQQERQQNADDRDDYEELDERERGARDERRGIARRLRKLDLRLLSIELHPCVE